MSTGSYATLPLPKEFNMATHILDDNIAAGRGELIAIYYQEEKYTYLKLPR